MAETLLNKYLRAELDKVGKRVRTNLQNSIKSRNLIGSSEKKLLESINYTVIVKSSSDFEIRLFWKDYGDALNFGADVGWLSRAGQSRLERWVVYKLRVPQFTQNKSGKRINNARKVARAIQAKWVRTGKFPSTISRGRGWASVALRSRGAADIKTLTTDALSVAFRKYLDDRVREENRKNKSKGRR
jgi:hypothetical protein